MEEEETVEPPQDPLCSAPVPIDLRGLASREVFLRWGWGEGPGANPTSLSSFPILLFFSRFPCLSKFSELEVDAGGHRPHGISLCDGRVAWNALHRASNCETARFRTSMDPLTHRGIRRTGFYIVVIGFIRVFWVVCSVIPSFVQDVKPLRQPVASHVFSIFFAA